MSNGTASLLRPDVELHLRQAGERLKAARLLLDAGFLPDAVSRAYYAMHHAAEALLASRNLRARTHGGIASRLASEFHETGLDLAGYLKAMELRAASDYESTPMLDRSQVDLILVRADAFLGQAKNILGLRDGER